MRLICIDGDEEVVRDAGLDVEKNVNAASRLVPCPSFKTHRICNISGHEPHRAHLPHRTPIKIEFEILLVF